jgi:hypothetical protein
MAGSRRDPSVERLADLTDDNEIVHRPVAQRAEQIRPGLRKGLLSSTKKVDETFPCVGRSEFARREIAKLHSRNQNPGFAIYQCYYRPLDLKNPSDFLRNDLGLAVFHQRAPAKEGSYE